MIPARRGQCAVSPDPSLHIEQQRAEGLGLLGSGGVSTLLRAFSVPFPSLSARAHAHTHTLSHCPTGLGAHTQTLGHTLSHCPTGLGASRGMNCILHAFGNLHVTCH